MRALFLVSICITLCLAATARAEDRDKARQAFAEGRQHFDLGEYKDALESFKLAYRNFEDPKILFNVAQCHRQLGNKEDAIAFYRKYLNKIPNAPNREEVQNTIDKLNAAMQAERTSKSLPPQGTLGEPPTGGAPSDERASTPPAGAVVQPAGVTPSVATTPSDNRPVTKKWWFWTAVAGGAVAIGLGVGLGVGLSRSSNTPGSSFPGVMF